MSKLVELGHLQPTDLLWREGFPDWRPAMVVFPPHTQAPSRGPRLTQPAAAGQARAAAQPSAEGADWGQRGQPSYAGQESYDDHTPRRWGRVLALVLLAVVVGVGGWIGYPYRGELAGLVTSLTASTGAMAIADRKSLETPPLLGFRAGSFEAIDANLQATALWRVVKREFPDWYTLRVNEAAALARDNKDDTVIGQFVAHKLVELRRQQLANGLSATLPMLKTVATAYFDTLGKLRQLSPEACHGFIRQGEAEPLIVALLQGGQGGAHTAHLQAELTAVFEAIGEGRQVPRVHPRANQAQHEMLANELTKRGWTQADFRLLSSEQAMAQAPPEKVCQLVYDFFAAQLALPDQEAQTRLLLDSLRPVFAG